MGYLVLRYKTKCLLYNKIKCLVSYNKTKMFSVIS